jgi:uncharacterized protein (TIGR00369 family)
VSNAKAELIEKLNSHRAGIIRTLQGRVTDVDPEAGTLDMEFDIGGELCHSVNIVQGGIVTAMLDATMSHATFAQQPDVRGLSSLEIKVSFLEPSLAGRFRCRGMLKRSGYKIGFLEGELFDSEGKLTATASTTAKFIRSAQA